MRSEVSRSGLIWVAAVVLLLAVGVWKVRHLNHIAKISVIDAQVVSSDQAQALLASAFRAGDAEQYTALTNTAVFMGGKWYHSQAQLTRAPGEMTISYLSGEGSGMQCGYNQEWAWSKPSASAPLEPYARLDTGFAQEEENRLQMLLHNYHVRWEGHAEVDKRPVDVLEITPRHPMDNASGPAKRIWIDRATRVPLRIETFNYSMIPVMRSSLSDLQFFKQPSPGSFVNVTAIEQALTQTPWTAYQMGNNFDEAGRIAGIFPPVPDYVPTGFTREGVGLHRCSPQNGGCYAALSRYTDGVNTLTLFALKTSCAHQMQLDQTPEGQQQNADGQVCVFGPGSIVTRNTSEGSLIAVADFPPAELQRVLNSTSIKLYSVTTELNGIESPASNQP